MAIQGTEQKDPIFRLISGKVLGVSFDAVGFSFCVVHDGRLFHVGRFEPVATACDQWMIEVALYFDTDPHLNHVFDRVVLCFVNRRQVVVPDGFYSPEKEENLLEFNTFLSENDPLEKNEISRYGCHLVFSYSEPAESILRKKYPRVELYHCGTSLLSTIHSRSDRKEMHLMFHRQQLDMAVVAGQKLILYNTFEYTAKEDVLYYVLFAAEQLDMDPNEFYAFVYGKIDSQGKIYELLYRYVRHVVCEKHEPIFGTSSKVLQEHYCLLFSLQCALSRES